MSDEKNEIVAVDRKEEDISDKGFNGLDEEKKLESAREISIKEGAFASVMSGFGANNITPYALALGAGNTTIALISSVPSLIGNFSQLFSSRLAEKYSRRKIVMMSVFAQAVMWLFLLIPGALYFGLSYKSGPAFLLVFYTMLVFFGAICGPTWSSWMRDIAPKGSSHFYFGRRNRIANIVALSSMLVAGFILDYFKQTHLFIAFAFLFFFSFVARSISAYLFTKQYEPKFNPEEGYYFSFLQFVKKMRHNNFGRFVIFSSLMSFVIAMASPFYAVYMLKNLGFEGLPGGYVFFMLITLAPSLTTILLLPFWGKIIDKFGCINTMRVTALFIPLVPFLWVLSIFIHGYASVVIFLFVAELFSGFVFSGFDLANGNFVYDAVSGPRMAICTSYLNFIRAIGAFIGAVIGGFIASSGLILFSLPSILIVFAISGIMRIIVYFIYIPRIKEVRCVECLGMKEIKESFEKFNLLKYFNSRHPSNGSAD